MQGKNGSSVEFQKMKQNSIKEKRKAVYIDITFPLFSQHPNNG